MSFGHDISMQRLPHRGFRHSTVYVISLCCDPFYPSAVSQQNHLAFCGFDLESPPA